MPAWPPVPRVVADWVRAEDLDQPENEPQLRREITLIVERPVPAPDTPQGTQRTTLQQVPERLRLADHPEVEEAWLAYLVEKWAPWAQEMRRLQKVQKVYETLDFTLTGSSLAFQHSVA